MPARPVPPPARRCWRWSASPGRPVPATPGSILGCGNPDGFQGRNLGRQTVLRAELPLSIAGTTITRFCASGLQSIAIAAGRIVAEGVDAMLAGGIETISGIRPGNNLPTDMDPWLVEHKPALYMAMIKFRTENVSLEYLTMGFPC